MIDLLRRRMEMLKHDEIIIDARKGGVSGDAANDAALMKVIYAQDWSKSPLYMTKREAEAVTDIETVLRNNNSIVNFDAFEFFTQVTTIPAYGFNGMRYLTSVKFPHNLSVINSNAFEHAENLSIINLPNSLQSIGYRAFRATKITSLYIPDSVTFIDGGITAHCKNVTSLVVSPDNTKYYSGEYNAIIEKNTNKFIMGCNNSTIPNETKVIARGAFNGIPKTSIILPYGLETIEALAFGDCNVTELIIPDSVTTILQQAFYNSKLVTTISIPDKVTELASNLMSNCTSLHTVSITNNIKSIKSACWSGCKKLTTINYTGTIDEWRAITKEQNWNRDVPITCVVKCSDGNIGITE